MRTTRTEGDRIALRAPRMNRNACPGSLEKVAEAHLSLPREIDLNLRDLAEIRIGDGRGRSAIDPLVQWIKDLETKLQRSDAGPCVLEERKCRVQNRRLTHVRHAESRDAECVRRQE